MRKLIIALAVLVVLVAIFRASLYRYYSVVEEYGVLTLTEHMVAYELDWEGGNTEGRYVELCNPVLEECFVRGYLAGPYWTRNFGMRYEISNGFDKIAVYSGNLNRKRLSVAMFRIYRTGDGREITCSNCTPNQWDVDNLRWFYWKSNRYLFLDVRSERDGQELARFWLADVGMETYNLNLVKEIELLSSDSSYRTPSLHNDGTRLAWGICNPECERVVLDLNTGTEEREPVPCESSPYVYWEDDKVVASCNY